MIRTEQYSTRTRARRQVGGLAQQIVLMRDSMRLPERCFSRAEAA